MCEPAVVHADRPRGQSTRDAAARDLVRSGSRDAPVEVVDYNPGWPARFEAERDRLARLLPGVPVHHIGSTAVPGLAAKPIIDLMALVDDPDGPIGALVEHGGYRFPAAFNADLVGRRWLCRPSASHRTHHLHLVRDPDVLERHLRFRDRLRADRDLADQYARLKRDLAERYRDDREAYSAAKAEFVRRVDRTPPIGPSWPPAPGR